jgi:hypothetical protein
MGVSPLPTRAIKHPGPTGECQQFNESRDLPPILREIKERFVLLEVLLVEVGGPPRAARAQKNTGSRYAPKTSSSAARISYSVQ